MSELQASVEELEAEGFADRQVLRKLKEQVRSSYASAPPEFIAEAREAGLACGEAAGQLMSIHPSIRRARRTSSTSTRRAARSPRSPPT